MHTVSQVAPTARAQFVQAVQEHWCSGEAEFYGLHFWLYPPVLEAMDNDPTSHPDLFAANHAAAAVAAKQGY